MKHEKPYLEPRALIGIAISSIILLVIGLVLLALGYNEAFIMDNSIVRALFSVITFLGEAIFLVILISIFFIVYDKKFAKNLAFNLAFSVYLNSFIKELFQDPRPPGNIDASEDYGYVEPGYGFPSGHTQTAATTWGYIAYEFKDKSQPNLIPILFSGLIFLIGISRVILGVHDLQDIVGGALIGIVFVLAFIYLEPIISEKIDPLGMTVKLIIAISIPMGLFIIGTLLFPTAGLGLVKDAPLYADAGGFAQGCGAMLGVGVGYVLEEEYVNYQPAELNARQKGINLIIGLLILFSVYFGLDMILEGHVVFRFLRYTIVGFILISVVPILFNKINKKP
ncbi:MAG: phosphatase PAP2 family protein [Promethearchaeota archaeon]